MTSSGESSVSYLCPQCQTKLTANSEDTGQRRQCPQCGKTVKVPGVPSQARSGQQGAESGSATSSSTGGVANIPIVCPLCGTRMYATKKQVGQTMVCPDCLETVVVPDRSPPKKTTPRPQAKPTASSTPTAPPVAGSAADSPESDEFRLADPVELPRHRSVTGALADLIDQHVAENEQPAADPKKPPKPPAVPATDPPRQFAIKCPVCDTMLQATDADIGTRVECPDCFSPIEVKRPRPKPRRVSDVVESNYEDDEFALDAPATLDVYKPTKRSTSARSIGEEALRKAREQQAQREKETPDLPLAPLWTNIFSFLRDGALIVRLIVSGALLGATMGFALTVYGLMQSADPSTQFFGMVGGAAVTLLTIVTITYISINFLNVLQESAEGCDKIEAWPENSLAEWITESFTLVMAVFFAIMPGMVAVLSTKAMGVSMQNAWLFAGLAVYAFFPITQLSILESASLSNPVSKPIIESLSNAFLLWCTFYLMTLFVGVVVAIAIASAIASVPGEHSFIVFVALGFLLSFAGFLYFRLLGRLAWACQMRPFLEKDAREEKHSTKSTKNERGIPDRDQEEHADG